MADLIKPKVKPALFSENQTEIVVNKFQDSCSFLDVSIFEPLIEEEQYFDDLDKYRFLAFLKAQFDSARETGLEKMIMKRGCCELCVPGHMTFEFYGQEKKPRFAYIIEIKDGEVHNIFNCNESSGWSRQFYYWAIRE